MLGAHLGPNHAGTGSVSFFCRPSPRGESPLNSDLIYSDLSRSSPLLICQPRGFMNPSQCPMNEDTDRQDLENEIADLEQRLQDARSRLKSHSTSQDEKCTPHLRNGLFICSRPLSMIVLLTRPTTSFRPSILPIHPLPSPPLRLRPPPRFLRLLQRPGILHRAPQASTAVDHPGVLLPPIPQAFHRLGRQHDITLRAHCLQKTRGTGDPRQ